MATKKEETTVVQDRFVGSKGWLWFWIIVCWPIAIGYYFMRKEPRRVVVKEEIVR